MVAENDDWVWSLHAGNFGGLREDGYVRAYRAHNNGKKESYLFADGHVSEVTGSMQ